MYIQSVIIDGFKSYGRRTEISGFDPEFTAITGLNGTGKSNILDSICFVLGISNLTQVRAHSLQDLVYKNGQAGITKATVTLIFNNEDPNQCPMGYEKCREISVTRQIAVGGKNKYLINGKLVQNKKAADFFCSIQLNVNNPNFLIMQGRITKVLNMKPQEIISMIEEAAGTSLYESKRELSTKLIEKKDAKVREMKTLLIEEIQPKLEKLKDERQQYNEYQNVCRDIEFLEGIYISYRYLRKKEAVQKIENSIESIASRIEVWKDKIKENELECEKIDEAAKELQANMDKEAGGQLKELEQQLDKCVQTEAKHTANLKALQSNITSEEKKLKSLEKSKLDDENALNQKETQMAKVANLFQSLREADEKDGKAYEEAQRRFQAVSQGLSTNEDGQASSLQDQLITAQKQEREAQTTIKSSEMELRHCRTSLKNKEMETQNNDEAYTKANRLQAKLQAEICELQEKINKIGYEEGLFERLQERKKVITQEIRQLSQQLDNSNAYRYELKYRDPEQNFDRCKMRGMVGKLVNVKDEKHFLGLTIAAGGGLYSYVTDDDVTSKKILQRGQLQNRVTFMPINKISGYEIPQKTVEIAQNLVGKENVQSALALIDFDCYYLPVMKYVFGSTLICRDLNIARQVTYNKNIQCRSVTLGGDVVDPQGTLSGGAPPKGINVLQELADIKRFEKCIQERKVELNKIDQQLASIEKMAAAYRQNKEKLDMHHHELEACKQRLAKTSFQKHQDEIDSLKANIATLEDTLKSARETQKSAREKVADIQAKLSDAKGYRERELKAATEEMRKAKVQAEASQKNWKKHEQEFDQLRLEIEELRKSIQMVSEQRDALMENLKQMKIELEQMRDHGSSASQKVSELKNSIKEQKDKINSQNKELKNFADKRGKLQKQNQELELEIKKKQNEENRVRNENKDALKQIEAMETQYKWILENRQYFGMKNTRYDYSKEDPNEAGQKLKAQREKKEKMERTLNTRAMMLFDRQEEEYRETMRRKEIVEQDKKKIQNIIVRMDLKKQEEVERAWKAVDKNFGSIFSSLLPGAQAALKPVKKDNCLIGLEIKVGFNGVWKESLGELSGGQRSLVALSLVLAMLKFSPAPLYILDEVDAALDMSHTQNIGNMLKTHFTNSQFIIVSLKDGMFNNANVLFRTKFEEGVSAVTRTVNKSTKRKN